MKAGLASAQSKQHLKKLEAAMAVTSPEVKKALEVIFAADSDVVAQRRVDADKTIRADLDRAGKPALRRQRQYRRPSIR